jgi:hypothetical protein
MLEHCRPVATESPSDGVGHVINAEPYLDGLEKGASLPCKRYVVVGTSSVGVLAKSSARISTRALRPDVFSSLLKYCTISKKRTTYRFLRERVILPTLPDGT